VCISIYCTLYRALCPEMSVLGGKTRWQSGRIRCCRWPPGKSTRRMGWRESTFGRPKRGGKRKQLGDGDGVGGDGGQGSSRQNSHTRRGQPPPTPHPLPRQSPPRRTTTDHRRRRLVTQRAKRRTAETRPQTHTAPQYARPRQCCGVPGGSCSGRPGQGRLRG
jgi:hypothetical protein